VNVTVLFFGILSDKTGMNSLMFSNAETLDELINELEKKFPLISQKKTKYIVSRNHEIVRTNVKLNEGDEIALIPPFSGG
jgi:molybdopterin converting factor small subunit